VLLGGSGSGKTHLLIGLGIAACEQAAESATPPAPSSSTSSSKPPTNAATPHPVSTVEPRIATLPPPDQRRASTSIHRGFTRHHT
jgi:hypothetical protein